MPRKPRCYLPGMPSHVVQRGHDRQACFFEKENYQFYLVCLGEACNRYDVALHAYVLMTNHVHLLMTPETESGISRVMQLVGNRYVQYINKKYCRSGSLWEGRHKASLVNAEEYLLACYRYIELNPVRANIVKHPNDYRWSSYRAHATGFNDELIHDHDLYFAIDTNEKQRQFYYRGLFKSELYGEDIHDIRLAVNFSAPLGNSQFKEQIVATTGRKVVQLRKGRPEVIDAK